MQDLQYEISQYLRDCKHQKGLDTKTIKAYRIDLAQFSAFMTGSSWNLTREGIMAYISDLHQRYKPKTIRRKIASVKIFCRYLEYEELLEVNPFARLRLKLSPPLILPRTIPLSVIEAILTATTKRRKRCSPQNSARCSAAGYRGA